MSYNGRGTFLISTAGQPVVTGTVISSTVFNALTADLATGLSTAICKDGQTTVTENIPFSGFKLTGIGAPTATGHALREGSPVGGTTPAAGSFTTLSASGGGTLGGTFAGSHSYSGAAIVYNDGLFANDAAGQTVFDHCEEGSFTAACTGPMASNNTTVSYSRLGDVVNLNFTSVRPTGNSSANPISLAMTNMPANMRPAVAKTLPAATVTDNGSDQAAPGVLQCTTSGAFTMNLSGSTTNFASTASTVGFYAFSVSYKAA